jgi:hypothetical protein
MEDTEARRIASTDEAAHVANLARKTRSVVVAVGSIEFMDSVWMRRVKVELTSREMALLQVSATAPPARTDARADTRSDGRTEFLWQVLTSWSQLQVVLGPPSAAGRAAAQAMLVDSHQCLANLLVLGPRSVGLAWWPREEAVGPPTLTHDVLAVDTSRPAWVADGPLPAAFRLEQMTPSALLRDLDVQPLRRLVATAAGKALRVDDLEPWEPPGGTHSRYSQPGLQAMAWSPVEACLAIVANGTLTVRDAGRKILIQQKLALDSDRHVLAWQPDGQRIAVGSVRGTGSVVQVVDVHSIQAQRPLVSVAPRVTALAWSPDGNALACATEDRVVRFLAPSLEGDPLLAWSMTKGPSPSSLADVHLAFSPRPLDATYVELAVADGDRIELLRVNPAVLVPASPPSASAVARAMDDDDRLEAALRVLQAMALAFHVGGIASPGEGRSDGFDGWLRHIGREEGIVDGNRLAHWMRMSEYVFWGPVRTVLMTGEDPVVTRDDQAAREAGRSLLEEWRKNVAEHDPRAVMTVGKSRRLAVAMDSLRMHEPRRYESLGGQVLDAYFDAVERVHRESAEPAERKGDFDDTAEALRQREQERAIDAVLAQPGVDLWLGRYAGPFHTVFSTSGRSDFSRVDNYLTYLQRLLAYWRETSERAFRHASPGGFDVEVAITFPTRAKHLDRIGFDTRLSEPVRYPGREVDGSEQTTAWSLTRRAYLELIDQLGEIVVDAVTRRLALPPHRPRVLWVDGEPDGKAVENYRIEQRGITLVTEAFHPDGPATPAPSPAMACDAWVFDIREGDEQQTWLRAYDVLRSFDHHPPVLLYADERHRARAEAMQREQQAGLAFDADALDDLLLRTLRRRAPPPADDNPPPA